MGILFSRKGKASSKETLQRLEKEIRQLEIWRNRNADLAKRVVVYLILSSILVFLLVGLLVFFFYRPKDWKQLALLVSPLVVFPILIYGLKRCLNYLFVQRVARCDARLVELRAEKKDVIDRVVNEEPFRVAKELLQRFDPKSPHLEQFRERRAVSPAQERSDNTVRRRQVVSDTQEPPSGARPLEQAVQAQREQQLLAQHQRQEQLLRRQQEIIVQQQRQLQAQLQRSGSDAELSASSGSGPVIPVYELMPGHVAGPAPGPPRPVPILPRERSGFDKVVEFLVGDGPNNRCALICAKCYSHNGMALPSEFEYCTFRCAYCYHLNPARKQQPVIHDEPTRSESAKSTNGQPAPVQVHLNDASSNSQTASAQDRLSDASANSKGTSVQDHLSDASSNSWTAPAQDHLSDASSNRWTAPAQDRLSDASTNSRATLVQESHSSVSPANISNVTPVQEDLPNASTQSSQSQRAAEEAAAHVSLPSDD